MERNYVLEKIMENKKKRIITMRDLRVHLSKKGNAGARAIRLLDKSLFGIGERTVEALEEAITELCN
jgi:hypothetical protein